MLGQPTSAAGICHINKLHWCKPYAQTLIMLTKQQVQETWRCGFMLHVYATDLRMGYVRDVWERRGEVDYKDSLAWFFFYIIQIFKSTYLCQCSDNYTTIQDKEIHLYYNINWYHRYDNRKNTWNSQHISYENASASHCAPENF